LVSDLLGVSARRILQALADGEADPLFGIGDETQNLFMNIDSGYPVRHKLLLAGAESMPTGSQAIAAFHWGERQRLLVRSTTHAPGQTGSQPQLLH